MTRTRTIAYFGSPHLGGTYSVYRQLRDGLRSFGWSVRWVGLGREAELAAQRCEWATERNFGEVVAAGSIDDRDQAAAFLNHIETMSYDAVFTYVLANRVQTNAVRYLDPRISRIMIVHNISPGTYAAARAIRDHVHATVGVSPRIRDDLVLRHGFPRDRTQAIATAFDSAVSRSSSASSDTSQPRGREPGAASPTEPVPQPPTSLKIQAKNRTDTGATDCRVRALRTSPTSQNRVTPVNKSG